jgi:hypothetical protein
LDLGRKKVGNDVKACLPSGPESWMKKLGACRRAFA